MTAARVDPAAREIAGSALRRSLDSSGSAAEIIAVLCAAVDDVAVPGQPLGVAMPDPFDYKHGIAKFRDVGKFDQLHGVDLSAAIADGARIRPTSVHFVNDADAFTLGEWIAGAARGARRCLGLTLGTGIGSGFLVDGRLPDDVSGLPRNGRVHNLHLGGVPLEDLVSRRAIRRDYAQVTGDERADVRDVAERARHGDRMAGKVLDRAFRALGATLAPVLTAFAPDVIVVGGSMSASWDLFEPSFLAGAAELGQPRSPSIVVVRDTEHAALIGAAFHSITA